MNIRVTCQQDELFIVDTRLLSTASLAWVASVAFLHSPLLASRRAAWCPVMSDLVVLKWLEIWFLGVVDDKTENGFDYG